MTWVADTNVVAELMRPDPDPRLLAWLRAHRDVSVATTAISVAEVGDGIARVPDGARKVRLQALAAESPRLRCAVR